MIAAGGLFAAAALLWGAYKLGYWTARLDAAREAARLRLVAERLAGAAARIERFAGEGEGGEA